MNINDIIALANAGFSKEEIQQIAAGVSEQPKQEEPKEEPKQEELKEEPKQEEPKEEPKIEAAKSEDGITPEQMLAEILGLKKMIQSNNINNSQMPNTLTTAQQADAALASIINPNGGK